MILLESIKPMLTKQVIMDVDARFINEDTGAVPGKKCQEISRANQA